MYGFLTLPLVKLTIFYIHDVKLVFNGNHLKSCVILIK